MRLRWRLDCFGWWGADSKPLHVAAGTSWFLVCESLQGLPECPVVTVSHRVPEAEATVYRCYGKVGH